MISFQILGHLRPLGPKTETLLDRDFESPAGICLIIILVENDVSLLARSIWVWKRPDFFGLVIPETLMSTGTTAKLTLQRVVP